MAHYSFALRPGSGYGSGMLSGLGPALFNALQAGFKTENDLYDLQNRVRTDPYTVPAQAAQGDAARLDADRRAIMTQNSIDNYNQLLGVPTNGSVLAQANPGTPVDATPVMQALGMQLQPMQATAPQLGYAPVDDFNRFPEVY